MSSDFIVLDGGEIMNSKHTIYYAVSEILPALKKYPDSLIKIYYDGKMFSCSYNDRAKFNRMLSDFGRFKTNAYHYSNGDYSFII